MKGNHRAEPRPNGTMRAPRKPERRAATAGAKRAGSPDGSVSITPEERAQMIARAAYFRAERRGFQPGRALDDWLESEVEIDRLLQDARA